MMTPDSATESEVVTDDVSEKKATAKGFLPICAVHGAVVQISRVKMGESNKVLDKQVVLWLR